MRNAKEYSRYGTATHKQVYQYGMLDTRPTEITRSFGMAWGMGGWLLFPFLNRVGPEVTRKLKQRVADELHTTFASHYAKTVSLAQMLDPAEIGVYARAGDGAEVPGGSAAARPSQSEAGSLRNQRRYSRANPLPVIV
jgi:hypothetical protein